MTRQGGSGEVKIWLRVAAFAPLLLLGLGLVASGLLALALFRSLRFLLLGLLRLPLLGEATTKALSRQSVVTMQKERKDRQAGGEITMTSITRLQFDETTMP